MERRKALAIAATVTCVLGSTTVAFASVGGVSLLGFGSSDPSGFAASATGGPGSSSSAAVEAETRDVYDRVVVEGTTGSVARGAEPPTSTATPSATVPPLPTTPPAVETRTRTTHRRHHASTAPDGEQPSRVKTPSYASTTTEPDTETTSPSEAPPSTTMAPATLPPVTTTTRPPGVPKDWPPGKPIPPMPPNCRHPELEDNGVWNCGDD